MQAGGIQDSDPGPTAGPHGVLQAQQGADGPRSHSQAHRRALQVPGDASWRESKEAGQQQGVGDGKRLRGPGLLSPREPRATAAATPGSVRALGPFLCPSPSPVAWQLFPSVSVYVPPALGAVLPTSPSLPSSLPFPLFCAFIPHTPSKHLLHARACNGCCEDRNKSDTDPALKKIPAGWRKQRVKQQLPYEVPSPSGQACTEGLESC